MKLKGTLFLLLLCLLSFFVTTGKETKEIEELKKKLAHPASDSVKVKSLADLSMAYRQAGDLENARKYGEDGVAQAKKTGIFIPDCKRTLALVYRNSGDMKGAIALLHEALTDARKQKSEKAQGDILNDIGTTYVKDERLDSALTYLIKAIKIRELIKDTIGIASTSANIGRIYDEQKDWKKAREYTEKAIELFRLKKQKLQLAMSINNLGNIYKAADKNYEKAMQLYLEALEMMKSLEKKLYVAQYASNIGNTYQNMGIRDKAEKYLMESIAAFDEIGEKEGASQAYYNMAWAYSTWKEFDKAIRYNEKSLALAEESGSLRRQQQSYLLMSTCMEVKGDFKKAHEYYKMQDVMEDTLATRSNKDQLNKLGVEFETEKKELQIKNLESAQALTKAEAGRQKTQKMLLATGLAAALLLGVLLLYGFIQKRKDNRIIESQKYEVEQQKELLEERNKDITDSINYARRIQQAILKSEEHISKHLPPHFILFKPKDIVSGDFYWALEKQGHLYLTAADCTGHGVPGAFLTLLGTSFLNEINAVEKLLSTDEILNRLRDKMIRELGQTGEQGGSKDGMDISLCRLNLATRQLQWSGANNPLYYYQDNQLKEIKANKQPIGYFTDMVPFTAHELQLNAGDSFYLFTDGYADQFGGPQGKKFKYKQLQELLVKNRHLPQEEQKRQLNSFFEEWRGSLEQVDDVCLIGVTVS